MPSPEMRQAMATAPLGDDVFGDDPTVNRLLEVAAERLGKEAAVFVPSGTMGNLIGVAVNAGLGEELIADAQSHIFVYETAGAAAGAGSDGGRGDAPGADRRARPPANRPPPADLSRRDIRGHPEPAWRHRLA